MNTMSTFDVSEFKDNANSLIEQVINDHQPIKVSCRTGGDFVVISAADWEQEQETLHVLQNQPLMTQIADSLATHKP